MTAIRSWKPETISVITTIDCRKRKGDAMTPPARVKCIIGALIVRLALPFDLDVLRRWVPWWAVRFVERPPKRWREDGDE